MSFFGDDYLLTTSAAETLFNDYAQHMPIFDYHNHLPVDEIYENKRYETITELWLAADHYKWRAMRAAGIEEKYVTGDGDPLTKFKMWGRTVERLIGCPLYDWTHLELQRYFGIEDPLTEQSAEDIYKRANKMLAGDEFTAQALLKRMNVKALCTTDDPCDDLAIHLKIKQNPIGIHVLPAFRPDSALNAAAPGFGQYLKQLGAANGVDIQGFEDVKAALMVAMDRFASAGCLLSDHGFVDFAYTLDFSRADAAVKAAMGGTVSKEDAVSYQSALLKFLAGEYVRRGWGMQIHTGALRSGNQRGARETGMVNGYDSVGNITTPAELSRFLNDINEAGLLPNTVLYPLNPNDNPVMATMAVSFAEAGVPGKVQLGSGWWFNDTQRGIRNQLTECMENGLLTGFVGMLTDSRSFTSFTRHEFFRRILCGMLGEIIDRGEYPQDDIEIIGSMVEDICYNNAVRFFNLKD